MNDCASMRELIPAYIDDELMPSQIEQAERHLSQCARCREVLEGLERDTMLLKATIGTPVVVSDRINDAVWAKIEAEDRAQAAQPLQPASRMRPDVTLKPAQRRSWGGVLRERFALQRWVFAGGMAAVALLLLATGWHRSQAGSPMDVQIASVVGNPLWRSAEAGAWQPLSAGVVLRSGDRLKTDEDDQVTAQWKDGSRAVVGPQGEGEVLRLFPGLDLKHGRVWAKIKRQSKETPFTVRSPHATAQVMGTEFSMEVPPAQKQTFVVVLEGAVRFFNSQGSVTVRDWSRAQAAVKTVPTSPEAISPLKQDSMWWVK
ncbi:MAG: FecR domain-containing protein [Armatimonadetes bacterium]|nr:FecR domain-containing protein [Armatimonadota bacterium]